MEKFNAPTMSNLFTITVTAERYSEMNTLTNMKKLICKVFRISPIKHYSLTIEFKSERVLRVNDIIFTTKEGIDMVVLGGNIKNDSIVYSAVSINPLERIRLKLGKVEVIKTSSAYSEI